jgi:hypothetical protein
MATKTESILSLLNQIRNDQQLVLPDLQRDFVWRPDQIRLLLDTIMREYPFGSLLLWQTRFLEVPYRNFVQDYTPALTFVPQLKKAGAPLRMVLDGQQRLQSLYIAVYGTHDRRRMYFNVTSGPGSNAEPDDQEDGLGTAYRFEFWQDSDENRPKRLIPVGEIVSWPARLEDAQIEKVTTDIGLKDDEGNRARRNIRLLRRVMSRSDLVPVETIDDEATDIASARTIDEILEIFVRVNTGGTRLSRSDLMFSFLKSKWGGARIAFDDLIRSVESKAPLGIDKDFIIRGLLMVTDSPVSYEVENVQRHWDQLEPAYEQFAKALKNTVDFLRSPDVGILSGTLVQPMSTLYPLVYHLYHYKNGSVADGDRTLLRSMLYFLLFNRFVRSEARIRYLRDELRKHRGKSFHIEAILKVIETRQKHHHIVTSAEMLDGSEKLALNIVQRTLCRETISWQESPEVDHIFPQSVFRDKYPHLVDDIGNLAFLGKLRNIRKSAEMPADYFAAETNDTLRDNFVISDRALLSPDRFEEFVKTRRELIVERVRNVLGR